MPIYISKLIVKNGVESGVQNEPITKNGVLLVTTLSF